MPTISVTDTSRWRSRFRTVMRVLGAGCASLCLIGVSAGLLPAREGAGERLSGTQGQVLVVKIVEADRTAEVGGRFRAVLFPSSLIRAPRNRSGMWACSASTCRRSRECIHYWLM